MVCMEKKRQHGKIQRHQRCPGHQVIFTVIGIRADGGGEGGWREKGGEGDGRGGGGGSGKPRPPPYPDQSNV